MISFMILVICWTLIKFYNNTYVSQNIKILKKLWLQQSKQSFWISGARETSMKSTINFFSVSLIYSLIKPDTIFIETTKVSWSTVHVCFIKYALTRTYCYLKVLGPSAFAMWRLKNRFTLSNSIISNFL